MGGRGGAGLANMAKPALEKSLNSRFKRYDYRGRVIYKIGSNYGVYDFRTKPRTGREADYLVSTASTLKAAKSQLDAERNLKRKRK